MMQHSLPKQDIKPSKPCVNVPQQTVHLVCDIVSKTKFVVVGREAIDEDRIPINVNGSEFEHVNEFPFTCISWFNYYIIWRNGPWCGQVDKTSIKRLWSPAQGSVYGEKSELEHQMEGIPSVHVFCQCWIKTLQETRLPKFHHQCIHAILGISKQWTQHISSWPSKLGSGRVTWRQHPPEWNSVTCIHKGWAIWSVCPAKDCMRLDKLKNLNAIFRDEM